MVETVHQPDPHVLEWLSPLVASARWEPWVNHGGFSGARLWRGRLAHAANESWSTDLLSASHSGRFEPASEFCLRAWPARHPDDQRLAWIHERLGKARHLGVLAVPIPGRDGRTFLVTKEARWELAEWLPGTPAPLGQATSEQVQAALATVACLHEAWSDERTEPRVPPAWLDRRHLLDQWLDPTEPPLRRIHEAQPRADWLATETTSLRVRIGELLQWFLPVAERVVDRWEGSLWPLQPVLRDLWSDHVLFSKDVRVTGILDYGAMRFDTVATDLGRLVGSLVGDCDQSWNLAAESYERSLKTGRLDASLWRFARDLEFVGLGLGIANWARWIWLDRRDFPDSDAVIARLLGQMDRLAAIKATGAR